MPGRFLPSLHSNPAPAPSPLAQGIAAGLGTGITAYKSASAPMIPLDPAMFVTPEEEETNWPLIVGGVVLLAGLGAAVIIMTRKPEVSEDVD